MCNHLPFTEDLMEVLAPTHPLFALPRCDRATMLSCSFFVKHGRFRDLELTRRLAPGVGTSLCRSASDCSSSLSRQQGLMGGTFSLYSGARGMSDGLVERRT